MHHAVHRLPAGTQLLERTDAQAAEGQHTAWAKYPARFFQHHGELAAPLHRQATEHQVDAGIPQWQALGVTRNQVLSAGIKSLLNESGDE
jgi:hypothetical protein